MEWICRKCAYTVYSKCVWDRSVFPVVHEDMSVKLFKSCVYKNDSNGHIIIDPTHKADDCTDEEFLIGMLEISKKNRGLLEISTCKHHFSILHGTVCELGHTHEPYIV